MLSCGIVQFKGNHEPEPLLWKSVIQYEEFSLLSSGGTLRGWISGQILATQWLNLPCSSLVAPWESCFPQNFFRMGAEYFLKTCLPEGQT